MIASTIVAHLALIGQLSQAGANRGGAQTAEFAQLLHGNGLIQTGQDLPSLDATLGGLGAGTACIESLLASEYRRAVNGDAVQAGCLCSTFVPTRRGPATHSSASPPPGAKQEQATPLEARRDADTPTPLPLWLWLALPVVILVVLTGVCYWLSDTSRRCKQRYVYSAV